MYTGEARGETEERRASLALTSVPREGRASARPGPWGAAAQHLPALGYRRVRGGAWKERSGEGTVFARLAALQPGSVPTPTSPLPLPAQRSLLPLGLPRLSRDWGGVGGRTEAGSASLSPVRARTLTRAQSGCRLRSGLAQVPRPHPRTRTPF